MKNLKKVLICIGYITLGIILTFGIFVLIQKSSSKDNSDIVQAYDSNTYFRNTNPNFTVDFVDNEYIRFESKSSLDNPFQIKNISIFQKILSYFGINNEKKGIQIALESISYDENTLKKIGEEQTDNAKPFTNFQLTTKGEDIYEDKEPTSKDTVISKDIVKGIDIEYQIIEGKGLKEEIVLKDLPEYYTQCEESKCILPANRYTFRFILDDGITLKKTITSIQDYPSGTIYFENEKGEYFGHLLPEYAVDSLGYKTSNINIEIKETDKPNEYLYILTLDHEWLFSNERKFPVKIDPSIVHDSSLSFDMGKYYHTLRDETSTVRLDNSLSGEYISSDLTLGDMTILENISWSALGLSSEDISIPYSEFGLQHSENFNDREKPFTYYPNGALAVSPATPSMGINIEPYTSRYSSIEFWAYPRYRVEDIQGTILKTNLGDIKIENGNYVLYTKNNEKVDTLTKVEFNTWSHISLTFDNQNSTAAIYINGNEKILTYALTPEQVITEISFGGNKSMSGYIDETRVYNRFLTKYEVISNTNYANIYLFFRGQRGGQWSEWVGSRKIQDLSYTPSKNIFLTDLSENLFNYDLIQISVASPNEEDIYISRNPIEGKIEYENNLITQNTGTLPPFGYFGLNFKPNNNQTSCIFKVGDITANTTTEGKVSFSNGTNTYTTVDSYFTNQSNQISLIVSDEGIKAYLNGNQIQTTLGGAILGDIQYLIGSECGSFDGEITYIYTSESSDIDPYSVYSKESRLYKYRPSFTATLKNGESLLINTDKEIYIEETNSNINTYYIKNLYKGDVLIVEEEIEGTKYQTRGEVTSVNSDTGLVEVLEWVGDIPNTGFTQSSTIYKEERIYIPIKEYLGWYEYMNSLYIGSTTIIEDLEIISGISKTDTSVFADFSGSSILQYKFVFTTKKDYLTPYLSSVNINYTSGGPTMDQVMRHGQWFNEEGKQGFWWAK